MIGRLTPDGAKFDRATDLERVDAPLLAARAADLRDVARRVLVQLSGSADTSGLHCPSSKIDYSSLVRSRSTASSWVMFM